MSILSKLLLRTHKLFSRIIPRRHRLHKLPTGGNVYIDISESPMMLARVNGTFEREKHRAIDYFLSAGDSFIDIGGNKGEFAIHAAIAVGTTGKVVCFEPEPTNCHWIRKSIEKSNVNNIVLEEAAIGSKEGSLELFIAEKSGWHSLVKSDSNLKKESVYVKVIKLDKYLEKNPLPNLKAIKIDVEGFEKEVLIGAKQTLSTADSLMLFIDIHPSHGVNPREIFSLLEEHNFSLFKEQYPYNLPINKEEKPLTVVAIKT